MKSIGGYFELELNKGYEYHQSGIRLNTGRNALEYILVAKKYRKIYLPYYMCDVLLEPIEKLGLSYEFYSINENFEPILFDFFSLKNDECFLYINYFGLKNNLISELRSRCSNLILDNSQAFYAKPLKNVDTFYSPRKFFGVPDGGYLFTNKFIESDLKQDTSLTRIEHLLRRIDVNAENGYSFFVDNERSLCNLPILKMSNLTKAILQSINYFSVAVKRRENFQYLHQLLKSKNLINFVLDNRQVPMTYPFLTDDSTIRRKLLDMRIYTPQYWPNVLNWVGKESFEYKLTTNIIHLPVDQRYSKHDLTKIVNIILDNIK